MLHKITKRVAFVMLTLLLNSYVLSFNTYADIAPKQDLVNITCQQISSWNHIKNKQGVYKNLQLPLSAYQPTQNKNTCLKAANISGVLVKNLVDWQQQHSNGIEINMPITAPLFGEVKYFNFELFIANKHSYLASRSSLLTSLQHFYSGSKHGTSKHGSLNENVELMSRVNELVDDLAHLNLVFYSRDHTKVNKLTLYGSYALTVDMKTAADRWQAISIPMNKLNFYSQKNYVETTISYEKISSAPLYGVILMAESANHKVLRNYLPANIPAADFNTDNSNFMAFNELSVTLKNIKFNR